MTRIQRNWTLATVLAGALFACAAAMLQLAIGVPADLPAVAPMAAATALAFALFVLAAKESRRP